MKKEVFKKLPTGFKAKWIEALRSGKYKQATGRLYLNDDQSGYCCLGVACKVAQIADNRLIYKYTIPEYFERVPSAIRGSEDEALVNKLVYFNDAKGWSFKRIATWIEKNL